MNTNKEITLDVQGMSCPSCIRHIKEALQDVAGVSGVDVRLAEGKVVVRHEREEAHASTFVEALRDAGYEAAPSPGT